MKHILVSKLTTIGSDNGLSPDRRQAIIWTNDGLLLIGPLGTNFSEILVEILTLSFKKMRLKVSSAIWRPSCLGLNVLSVTSPVYFMNISYIYNSISETVLSVSFKTYWPNQIKSCRVKDSGDVMNCAKFTFRKIDEIKNNAWVTVNNDFWVTSEAICQ